MRAERAWQRAAGRWRRRTGRPGAPGRPPAAGQPGVAPRKRNDFLYYGLRNKKLVFGLSVEVILVLAAIIGPISPRTRRSDSPTSRCSTRAALLAGHRPLGHDLFSQLTNGLRESYLVGALGAVFASVVGMALGFIAGWRGGLLDEVLQMITNVIVMIPSPGPARRDRFLPDLAEHRCSRACSSA